MKNKLAWQQKDISDWNEWMGQYSLTAALFIHLLWFLTYLYLINLWIHKGKLGLCTTFFKNWEFHIYFFISNFIMTTNGTLILTSNFYSKIFRSCVIRQILSTENMGVTTLLGNNGKITSDNNLFRYLIRSPCHAVRNSWIDI